MKPLAIGIICHPGLGGSGIVATQLGAALARRGHTVHFVCSAIPARLSPADTVHIHLAQAPHYPVFREAPYPLALAAKLVDVARAHQLDVLHAHYALPHATAAWMAREILGGSVRTVTTLHGTDVTMIGADPSYLSVVRHSVQSSDAVTTPSAYLRGETHTRFGADIPITVIPNFVDTAVFAPLEGARTGMPALFGNPDPVLVHVSNFRPVKRVATVLDIFRKVLNARPANLLLIGDGPDHTALAAQAKTFGERVRFAGQVEHVAPLLRACAAFIFPSESESFGLAALEAMACGVPVVASAVGGVPEVVLDGRTGHLLAVDDVDGMARATVQLLSDPDSMRQSARAHALHFREDLAVSAYETVYRNALS